MAKEKESKHDEYVRIASLIVNYIDEKTKTIGVFSTNEDMKKANNNHAVKKLVKKFNYHIQMLIK